ncbi:hypothetical protein KEM55_002653 [Ascosphaera atra]|nr:hypothetical protein KEM55_002653 [Ascosphaera atra]
MDVIAATLKFEGQQRLATYSTPISSLLPTTTDSFALRNPFSAVEGAPKKKQTLAVIYSEYDPPKLRKTAAQAAAMGAGEQPFAQ